MPQATTSSKRVPTPTVLQLEPVESGVACLKMVLEHFGRIVSLPVLREECGVSRDGTKASNIVKVARNYGLNCKAFSKPADKLPTMPLPLIVFWQFSHYLVVEGFDGTSVFVNDPASGHRTMSLRQFESGYTGIVFAFNKRPDFRTGGQKQGEWTGLTRRLSHNKATLLFAVLVSVLLTVPSVILPSFVQVYLDAVVIEGRNNWLRPLVVSMATALGVQMLLLHMQNECLRRLRINLAARMKTQFFERLMQLPVRYYTQRFPGEIASRLELNDRVAETIALKVAKPSLDLLSMVLYAAVMLTYSVPLTLVSIGLAVTMLLTFRWILKRRGEADSKLSREGGQLAGTTLAGLRSIETLKSSGDEVFFAKWSAKLAQASAARQHSDMSMHTLGILPSFLTSLAFTSTCMLGGYEIIHGRMTIGMLVAIQTLLAGFLGPLESFARLGPTLQSLRGQLHRLDDVLDHPLDPDPQLAAEGAVFSESVTAATVHDRLTGHIELRNVTFGYSHLDPPLVSNLNLQIEPGQRVAFVGPSGSGKSTIARLICGLYEPWSGEILFDGHRRQHLSANVLASSLSLVEQEISIFEGTVRDNLSLWDQTATAAVLHAAARDAAFEDVLAAVSGGMEGRLSEGGRNLSTGQRQRLEIARAITNEPRILVLDEATSALDVQTEHLVETNLRHRGCTCIVIAHRLSTIRDCDEIIMLEEGKVVERGTHAQLMQANGAYARLVEHS